MGPIVVVEGVVLEGAGLGVEEVVAVAAVAGCCWEEMVGVVYAPSSGLVAARVSGNARVGQRHLRDQTAVVAQAEVQGRRGGEEARRIHQTGNSVSAKDLRDLPGPDRRVRADGGLPLSSRAHGAEKLEVALEVKIHSAGALVALSLLLR